MVHIERIDKDNAWEVIELRPYESQYGFVASNMESLMEAYLATITDGSSAFPFAIYDDDVVVGFLMIGHNEAAIEKNPPASLKGNYCVWRLMIDKEYQGKGFGRATMKLALDFIRTFPCGEAELCEISYEPENEVAKNLYHSLGFVENGEMDGDEIVAVLKL